MPDAPSPPTRAPFGLRARLFGASLAVTLLGLVVARIILPDTIDDALGPELTWRLLGAFSLFSLATSTGLSWLALTLAQRPVDARAATELDELADDLDRSRASLERERDRLGAILEGMVEGVLVIDAEGNVALANRAVREMFLVERDVVGRKPIEALRNADLHELFDEASRARSDCSRELSIVGVRPRKVMAHVALIDNPGGGAVAVLSDVTELRRLETIRRDFVANVSHELRTPVAAIRAAAETLLTGALSKPDTAQEFVSIVDRHAERLHRLVEDLLELSRLESREFAMNPEALSPGESIEHAIELMALAARGRSTVVRADVAPELGAVEADRRALEHVLTNLIDNAIKYSPEGSRVIVRARPHARGVRVTVEDNGPGIEARHLPRIFERFYRVDASRSRFLGGTGLGLAIVKHMCEAMRAEVSVESALGRGTSFHVDLRSSR